MDKLTKDQTKGVDLIVKAVMKKHPFIKGGELSDDYKKFDAILFINLNVDLFQLTEENGHKLYDAWIQDYETNGPSVLSTSTLSGFIHRDETYYGPDDIFHLYYDLSNQINDELNQMYDFLPGNMKVEYKSFGLNDKKSYVNIHVGEYKQYK
jgi:hypothetical protein|tara:strand:- start:772 stop:1227 length:456 start_codon:yes stop_codon:yes gene_type:complete